MRKCEKLKCKCGIHCLITDCNPDWIECFKKKEKCIKFRKVLERLRLIKKEKIKANDVEKSDLIKRVVGLKRKFLREGILVGDCWSSSVDLDLNKIRNYFAWLEEVLKDYIDPVMVNDQLEIKGLEADSCIRRESCYLTALKFLRVGQWGDAFHETHDVVYGFGNDLDEDIPYSEVKMLLEIIEQFNKHSDLLHAKDKL